jgi:uncharacterized membrane protein HdeD (DUF308 family)
MNSLQKQLATTFSRNWWVLLLRGLAAIAFGILTWLLPEISLITLVLLFGAYALADGILGIWIAISGRKEHEDWWVLFLWALSGVGFGILTLLAPGITAFVLLLYIAAWAIVTGVLQIVSAIRLRKEITGEWLFILAGIASVVFGVLLMAQPSAGAFALLWLIAAYAVIFGVLLVILAFKVRTFRSRPAQP